MGIFSPDIPSPPPVEEDPRLKEWERQEAERRRRIARGQVGRAGTLLTGGLGAPGEATVARKTLLGE